MDQETQGMVLQTAEKARQGSGCTGKSPKEEERKEGRRQKAQREEENHSFGLKCAIVYNNELRL